MQNFSTSVFNRDKRPVANSRRICGYKQFFTIRQQIIQIAMSNKIKKSGTIEVPDFFGRLFVIT